MNKLDLILQREERKRNLKQDLLKVIKKHQAWEVIGVPEGTQITADEIRSVVSYLFNNVWSSKTQKFQNHIEEEN